MLSILYSDVYRMKKSIITYVLLLLASGMALVLVISVYNDVHLGISVLGDPTIIKNIEDVFLLGLNFRKGLGVIIAILISLFIGQEYAGGTLKLKLIAGKSRTAIYLSKMVCSIFIAVAIMIVYEVVIILGAIFVSGTIDILGVDSIRMLICGVFLYGALGAVLCFIAMISHNYIAAVICCLAYVFASETIISVIQAIVGLPTYVSKIIHMITRYSINVQTSLLTAGNCTMNFVLSVVISMMVIAMLITIMGVLIFRKYDIK